MIETESQTSQPASSTAGGAQGGFLEQVRPLWKHRYLVLAIAAAVTALVALWTLRQPKIYLASVSIEFASPPRPLGTQVQDVNDDMTNYFLNREYYETQYHVITSHRVADAVVRQLGLMHDPDFLGVPPNMVRSFRSVSVTQAASALIARLKVDPVKDSRLVNVSVEDTSPRRAQLLANTVAAVYIRLNLEQRLSSTVSALEWLGQQLESLRTQLESSEDALHQYRMQHGLLSVSFEDQRNQVGNRVTHLADALTDTITRRIAIQARVTELRRAAESNDPLVQQAPELLSSTTLQTLRMNYEAARRERDSLATRYGDNAVQMLAANSRVNELANAIHDEVLNVVGAAEAELRQVRHIEGDLRDQLADAQREGLELNLREIEYGRLQRTRENNAKLYGIVLERTKETDLTRMQRVNNIRVLDDALMPGAPIKPRVLVNIGGGMLAGLLLGLLVGFLLVQADRSVRSRQDIEEELKATFLGVIPRVDLRGRRGGGYRYGYRYGYADKASPDENKPITNIDLIVHTHPTSASAEACRVIRTNLLFMSPDRPFQSLMVASADPREGKTTAAISLAITLAQSGKKVLLIDTDLRRPRVDKAFGLRVPVGITSVLVNEATLEEAVVETEVPNLSLLACGAIPPNPAELLHSQRFQDLLQLVRTKYDRIVFDTPPVGPVTDALIIAPQVDGTVLVARARKTLRTRAAAMLDSIRALGGRIAGVVLNDFDLRGESEGSYYYYVGYSYKQREQREAA